MYKAVAQSMLLYERDISKINGDMIKVLIEFHHQEVRWITGILEKCGVGGEW